MAGEQAPKLVSIESVLWSCFPNSSDKQWHWKVVMACADHWGNRYLESTFYLEKKDFAEDNVLAVARNYFAQSVRDSAEDTREWVLTDEQWEASKIKPPVKAPIQNTAIPS